MKYILANGKALVRGIFAGLCSVKRRIDMKPIFITATNTNIGKTYTTLKLLHKLSTLGYKVGAFKPIETGVDGAPLDASLLLQTCQKLNPNFKLITIDDICPIQLSLPAAPYVANSGKTIDFKNIMERYKKIKRACDVLLIEGAGGLLVPVLKDFYMVDFIKLFDAHALLVTHDKLGAINETLLSLEALKNRNISHNWCINHFKEREDFKTITLPFYQDHFAKIFSLQNDLDALTEVLITNCNGHRDS
jgi:dethiobiotin synthetase